MAKRKIKLVDPEELSTPRMTMGNEKKYKKVIDFVPIVKEWVGFGWIDAGEPTADDYKKLHFVRRDFTK